MRRFVPALLALLLAVPACRAGEPPKDKDKAAKPATSEQQYKDFVRDFDKQVQQFNQAYSKAKTREERQKLLNEKRPPDQRTYASKILKLVEAHPTADFAPDALAWVVTHTGFGPDYQKARTLLLKDHIKSRAIAYIIPALGNQPSSENAKLLQRVVKENPNHQLQGWAAFTLAQILIRQHKDKEAAKEFEKVAKDYADVKLMGRSLADQAKGELYEMQHLAVGMVAPNIVGEDADGKKFQLSDYRGKVVVLDFWAEW